MKKYLALLLALVMALSLFAGCGDDAASTPTSQPSSPAEEPAEPDVPEEPVVEEPAYVIPEGEPAEVYVFYDDTQGETIEWTLSLYVDDVNGKLYKLSAQGVDYYGIGWNVNTDNDTAMTGPVVSLAEGESIPGSWWASDYSAEWVIVNVGIFYPDGYENVDAYVEAYGAEPEGPAAVLRTPGIEGEHYGYIDSEGNAWLITVDAENKQFEMNDGTASYTGVWFVHGPDDQVAIIEEGDIPAFFESDGHVNFAVTEDGWAIPATDPDAAERTSPKVLCGSGLGTAYLYLGSGDFGCWVVNVDVENKQFEMNNGSEYYSGVWFAHSADDQVAIIEEGDIPAFFESDGHVNFVASGKYCAPVTDTAALDALPPVLTPGIDTGVSYYYTDPDGVVWLLTVDAENKQFEMNNGTDSVSGPWFVHDANDQVAIIDQGAIPGWWNADGHMNWAIEGDTAIPQI